MSNTDIKQVTISTSLLEAVARWAAPESNNRLDLSQIVFRADEVVAVDGHRLVRVPIKTFGLTFGLRRADAFAAIAAQDAWYQRGGPERPRSRTLSIRRGGASGMLEIGLGNDGTHSFMLVKEADVGTFPPIDSVMPVDGPRKTPIAIGFNPKYLAAIDEVVSALDENTSDRGVKVTGWGNELDPMLFEGPAGSRFVIMPTRI